MSQAPYNSAEEQATGTSSGEDRSSDARSLDRIFEILAAERRRHALYVLFRRTEPITLTDLAVEVASLEAADSERVAATLHHVHLPKLVSADVAEYDAATGTVRIADPPDRFRKYLTSAAEDEHRPLRRASQSTSLSEF
ncbi:hypothetical protein [Halorussus sp. MSC15.2]|uniref:DUF7344 domain-containing protein n=1 Tax=Halorussus sp. MSC15.2 TaxID=2283638 RepID=UPI0019685AAF|nr:hypothetical protein [Halorussus sp. MSC15.2]